MINEKELEKLRVKVRSATIGQEIIKVIYLGNLAGFYFGKVIEAEARYVQGSGKKHPYPKWKHCDYQIKDEDGDYFPISEDGINFYKGFYPVPDSIELGPILN